MKRFAARVVWVGLILAGSAANAQMLAPYDPGRARYQAASDFEQPYVGPLPPLIAIRGVPRPPLPVPHAENRAVPLPTPKPTTSGNPPEPTRQSTADAKTGTEIRTAPQASPSAEANGTVGEAKPKPAAPQILPTQAMPKVQALE